MYRGKRPVPGGTLFFTQLYHDIFDQLIARLSRLEQIVRIGEGKDGIRERKTACPALCPNLGARTLRTEPCTEVFEQEELREAMKVLVRVESARRLAALGGADPHAQAAPRHRNAHV